MLRIIILSSILSAACVSADKIIVSPDPDHPRNPPIKELSDIPFAEESGVTLHLDLFLPANIQDPPLIVWIHGGGWIRGSRKPCPVMWLVDQGYAVASIDYRLSTQAIFPAQIHDCKGAIRWLRAHENQYGYDSSRIAVMGSSAGGHLAVLLGTSGGMPELEGAVGGNPDVSSRVQAIVDYFGPTDFMLRARTQPQFTEEPAGTNYRLFGGAVTQHPKLAELAGGINHVSKDDPPLLIFHGLMDNRVEVQQSICLYQKYKNEQLPVKIKLVDDAGHGGSLFYNEENRQIVNCFLNQYLHDKKE